MLLTSLSYNHINKLNLSAVVLLTLTEKINNYLLCSGISNIDIQFEQIASHITIRYSVIKHNNLYMLFITNKAAIT